MSPIFIGFTIICAGALFATCGVAIHDAMTKKRISAIIEAIHRH
jgi:hypothetical protein